MIKYQEFTIKNLFDIHPTKAYKLTNKYLFDEKGTVPVVTNTSSNHGRGGFSSLAPTEKNIVTFSDTGTKSPDTFFYQEGEFIGYPHVQGMYPYSDKWNRNSLMYLITLLKRKTVGVYDYSTKMTRADILEMDVLLPVTDIGEINFDYMESYIQKLGLKHIKDFSTYLEDRGLNNSVLDNIEKSSYNMHTSEEINFKKFKLGTGKERLFDITSPKKRFNANRVKFGGKHPYVARSSTNNGIRGYITQDESYLNEGKTISFGQDTATIFYQEKPYFTGDKIKIMTYLDRELTSEIACYLITVMRKAFQDFTWGQTSFNEKILKDIEILLPVTEEGNVDYNFISNYIRAHEKLAIKDVVALKNKLI